MILEKRGESITLEGKLFVIGGRVHSNGMSDYADLDGTVTEIRTDDDRDTDNETPDIYVCFDIPEKRCTVKKIEARFTELYGQRMTIDDIALDCVIMAPDMLDLL